MTSTFRSTWLPRLLAATIILGAIAARIAYLGWHSSLDLAPDEAHYWDWSRRLDWAYYSKGPLVALLIRLSCELFGSLSIHLTGSEMLAVRLPAVVCGGLLLTALYVLTVQVWRREWWALAVVAVALTFPMVAAGSSLMTIDAPFTCLWAWALVSGFEAAVRGRRWAWPLAGLLVALGILTKPTMVLWIPAFGVFLIANPALRPLVRGRDFWAMTFVAALGAVPILAWNACHDWVTFLHEQSHAGVHSKKLVHWSGPLNYVGMQAALLLGYWFVAWAASLWRYRPWTETRLEEQYLWWMSAPIFVFFGLFSLKNGGGEPNWPIVCYLSGCVLAAGWFAETLSSPRPWFRRGVVAGITITSCVGLTLALAAHFPRACTPLFAAIVGPATPESPAPIRRIDPTCRLRGWRYLGEQVAEACRQNPNALVAATHWTLPGEIAFHVPSHPTVYTFGPALFDRHSQYDLWHPNPLDDVGEFKGKSFIVIGSDASFLSRAFDHVEPTRLLEYREGDHLISLWTMTICHGYRGFDKAKTGDAY